MCLPACSARSGRSRLVVSICSSSSYSLARSQVAVVGNGNCVRSSLFPCSCNGQASHGEIPQIANSISSVMARVFASHSSHLARSPADLSINNAREGYIEHGPLARRQTSSSARIKRPPPASIWQIIIHVLRRAQDKRPACVRCRRRLSDPALWQQQQRRPSTISTRIHHGASRLSPESLMRARGAGQDQRSHCTDACEVNAGDGGLADSWRSIRQQHPHRRRFTARCKLCSCHANAGIRQLLRSSVE